MDISLFQKYKHIMQSPEFDYISDKKNIDNLISAVRSINVKDIDVRPTMHVIRDYALNMNRLSEEMNLSTVSILRDSILNLHQIFKRFLILYSNEKTNRLAISNAIINKNIKTIEYHLIRFEMGLRMMFDPDIISEVRLNSLQLCNFIIDKDEGLGRVIKFNKNGTDSFYNKISHLNTQELIVVNRLLVRPSSNQKRTINGWTDLGIRNSPVRILTTEEMLHKKKAYFLYKVNEHKDYEAQLRQSPKDVHFIAA